MTLALPHSDPTQMSSRARKYLVIAALRHGIIGLFILVLPFLFKNAAFVPLVEYTHLWTWGAVFVAIAITCAAAAKMRKRDLARLSMIASAASTAVTAFAVLWGVVETWILYANGEMDAPSSPFVVILLAAIAAKDYIICGQPMRTPFEDFMEVTLPKVDLEPT